jgi:hypothetical protein
MRTFSAVIQHISRSLLAAATNYSNSTFIAAISPSFTTDIYKISKASAKPNGYTKIISIHSLLSLGGVFSAFMIPQTQPTPTKLYFGVELVVEFVYLVFA